MPNGITTAVPQMQSIDYQLFKMNRNFTVLSYCKILVQLLSKKWTHRKIFGILVVALKNQTTPVK